MIEDVFRPIARDGAGTIEVGLRLQKALAALVAVDERGAADCLNEAQDAVDRGRTALSSDRDIAELSRLHHTLWGNHGVAAP